MVAARHPRAAERDLGDAVLAPGFVDAHCHLEWSLLGGLLPAAPFGEWLGAMLGARARMAPADHAAAARLGALTALRAGTTTLADSGPTGAGVEALAEAGLRGLVHLEVFGAGGPEEAAARAAEAAEAIAALDDRAGPLVRLGVSPHAPYSAGPALWAALAAHPGLSARPWATHLAESPHEEAAIAAGAGPLAATLAAHGLPCARWRAGGGESPVARVAAGGALRPGLVAAHCVHLSSADPGRLAAAEVAVAHCPTSNARLRCGTAPLAALLRAGVRVGLGTDGPASAGPYDLRAEARACAAAHAGSPDPPGPAELLRLMTEGGARALGMGGVVGALAPGLRADLVAVRPSPGADPGGDPHALLLDPSARVAEVVVDGETLLADGVPARIDAGAIEAEATERRARLC